jgi:ferredoxin-NADP reductase
MMALNVTTGPASCRARGLRSTLHHRQCRCLDLFRQNSSERFLSTSHIRAIVKPSRNKTYSAAFGIISAAAAVVASAAAWTLWRHDPTPKPVLDRHRFLPFELVSKQSVSSTSSIFTFRPTSCVAASSPHPYDAAWLSGVWSVEFKQPQLHISRAYTPLPPTSTSTPTPANSADLRFLIRSEPGGEVSRYLAALPLGATVALRGPNSELALPHGATHITFLAAGTGIAPALQVAHLLSTSNTASTLHILWATRRHEDCAGAPRRSRFWFSPPPATEGPVVAELQALQVRLGERLVVEYHVDEDAGAVDVSAVQRACSVRGLQNATTPRVVLVAGPDGFVHHVAGPKKTPLAVDEDAEPGGLLARAGVRRDDGWRVIKL